MLTRMARMLTRMARTTRWLAGSHIIHTHMLTASSDFRVQGAGGSCFQSIYELTVTHP